MDEHNVMTDIIDIAEEMIADGTIEELVEIVDIVFADFQGE